MAKFVDGTCAIFGTIDEAGDTRIRVDPATKALVVINWEKYLTHQGELWSVSYLHRDVPDGGYADSITIPCAEHIMHVSRARWWSTGEAILYMHPLPTIGDLGDPILPANFSIGGSTHIVGAEFYSDPEVIDPGPIGFEGMLPGGFAGPAFDNRSGGYHEIVAEWQIYPGVGPILGRLQNLSGAPANIAWQFVFYGHEPYNDV